MWKAKPLPWSGEISDHGHKGLKRHVVWIPISSACIVSVGITCTSRMTLRAIPSGSQLEFLLALASTGTSPTTWVTARFPPSPRPSHSLPLAATSSSSVAWCMAQRVLASVHAPVLSYTSPGLKWQIRCAFQTVFFTFLYQLHPATEIKPFLGGAKSQSPDP